MTDRDTLRKTFIAAPVVVAVAIALALSVSVWMRQSEAFRTAEAFVRAAPEVEELIGPVREVSLSSSGESAINNYGEDGNATLSLKITGAKAQAIGEVHLVKHLRLWHVAATDIRRLTDNRLISVAAEPQR